MFTDDGDEACTDLVGVGHGFAEFASAEIHLCGYSILAKTMDEVEATIFGFIAKGNEE